MLHTISIENYKSIPKLSLDLGRVTVLIGENGCGKSNILEAIALASAASQDKLDNEFLISRGIRVTEPQFMRSAFGNLAKSREAVQNLFGKTSDPTIELARKYNLSIKINVKGDNNISFGCEVFADERASFPRWHQVSSIKVSEFLDFLRKQKLPDDTRVGSEAFKSFVAQVLSRTRIDLAGPMPSFLIYAPENSALRTFQSEAQILPLGIRGEGLFAHLKGLDIESLRDKLNQIRENLKLIEWFETFAIPDMLSPGERVIKIQDRFLAKDNQFDQRSANEGFLYLLFYITLFISPETPAFFSIDNIDSSLNPKMCTVLMQQIIRLAKSHDKQVILTTHNPAVLDGLDLSDESQRLLVVSRDKRGHTRTRRVSPPNPAEGQQPISLSEAFMRGYIGGLPKNF